MKSILSERYPDLLFLFTFFPAPEKAAPERKGEEEIFLKLPLDQIEVLYLYGIGSGAYYNTIAPWLKQYPSRALILLEDDLSDLFHCLQGEYGEMLLTNPQVHLRYIPEANQWEEALEELALSYPVERVEALAMPYKNLRKWNKLRLTLLRNTAAFYALLAEALNPHRLFANLLPNLRRLPEAFYANAWGGKFKGVPAVICGAGPSLEKGAEALKGLENKALLIAGGSALAALSRLGVTPHLGMALDPNREEYERLKPNTAFDLPLLFASRLFPDVFATSSGPWGYLLSDTGGAFETWMEKELGITGEAIGPDLGREAFSVTTLAVAFATHLGCSPILFCGVDLAFTGKRRYSSGVVDSNQISQKAMSQEHRVAEKLVRRKDIYGKPLLTSLKWIMESDSISAYAEKHPDTVFINATEGGLGFSKIVNSTLQEAVQTHCTKNYDLRGLIHCLIEETRFSTLSSEQIEKTCQRLRGSVERALFCCEEILKELKRIEEKETLPLETGKMVSLQLLLEEEEAFSALVPTLGDALDRLLQRYFYPHQDRKVALKKERAKWEQFLHTLQQFQIL